MFAQTHPVVYQTKAEAEAKAATLRAHGRITGIYHDGRGWRVEYTPVYLRSASFVVVQG